MNAQCKGQDFSYRLDRPPVLNWINDPNRATQASPCSARLIGRARSGGPLRFFTQAGSTWSTARVP